MTPFQGISGCASRNAPDPGPKSLGGDDVDLAAQQLLDVDQESAHVQQGAAGGQLHEQIDVTVRTPLPPSDRAEHPHIAHAVDLRKTLDLHAACTKISERHHTLASTQGPRTSRRRARHGPRLRRWLQSPTACAGSASRDRSAGPMRMAPTSRSPTAAWRPHAPRSPSPALAARPPR